ncbi:hypothetical protein [Actinomadura madurae]|uniref:hypothetical protein n=1 Tax=Actinomadura madurae TaxID=1993 RepID=UPI000DCF82F1|nr:hypothetical protein [Actinomadura madurae]
MDELLQRIQSDRQRSAGGAPAESGGSYGGGSLNDPLGDPLSTGSFGTTSSAPPSPPGTGNTGPWPSQAGGQSGGYDPGLGGGSGYDSGLGAPSGYGQGQQSDGYPTAPAYGESPRYDDPLSGGREPFGAFGGTEGGAPGPGGAGNYGDFSGSSYNGGDPLAAPHDPGASGGYQQDPNATQAYGSGYYGGSQQQQGGGYPQGGQQNEAGQYGSRQPAADDWENYRR